MQKEYQQPFTDIQNFYAGRSLFITGVSGFLGKALLEKLLRSCPNIGTINVLIRSKSGFDAQTRLKSIFQSPIFAVLKSQNSDAFTKVRPIVGDITLPNLGIDEEDRLHLVETVSVVIHSAASVKFNEPIKIALNINYHGTERVLALVNEMRKLVSFVHVSTAYSNCDLKHIPESIISQAIRPEGIDAMSDEEAEQLTPSLLGDKPNTYTFTKALTECLLKEQGAQLPVAIVRPSIIGASWQEPEPGFVDSTSGITGIMAASGKGFLTCMCGDGANTADIIPLDVTANLLIAVGYDVAQTFCRSTLEIPVYNCCTGGINPTNYNDIWSHSLKCYEEEAPFNDILQYPSLCFRKSLLIFHLINFFATFLPCLVLDGVALLTGKKVKMVRTYWKLVNSVVIYHYFGTHEWSFESRNFEELQTRLSDKDGRFFFTNVKDLKWSLYIRDYARGIKKWIFKEDMDNVMDAKKRMARVYWIQKLLWIVVFLQCGRSLLNHYYY